MPGPVRMLKRAAGEFLGLEKEVAVEPLVGHLRHPYAVAACQPKGEVVSQTYSLFTRHLW